MNILGIFSNYESRLQKEIPALKNNISHSPPGKLVIWKTKGKKRFYLYSGNGKLRKRTSISIKTMDQELLKRYALKAYDEARLKDAEIENKAILAFKRVIYKEYGAEAGAFLTHVMKLFASSEEYRSLLMTEDETEWAAAPYEKKTERPEELKYTSQNGLKCRSKSEAIIASILEARGISFRYEQALHVNGITYHPDFTIYDRTTGQIIYWEHFGSVDKPNYRRKMLKRINDYASIGIYPMINMITSFETGDAPFDYRAATALVDYFFGVIK
ncbi:MAG: hypothetical protein J6P72_08510 [Firmicutes bacterium]|nr:hypothetical protein [Bacillota bacterium]